MFLQIIRSRNEARRQAAAEARLAETAAAAAGPPDDDDDVLPEAHPVIGRRRWYMKAVVTLVVPLLGYAFRRILTGERCK